MAKSRKKASRLDGGKTGRDRKGRFTKGNPGGPGRPPREREVAYLAAVKDSVPVNEWVRIVRKAVEQARRGDRHARQFVCELVLPDLELAAVELREMDRPAEDVVGDLGGQVFVVIRKPGTIDGGDDY